MKKVTTDENGSIKNQQDRVKEFTAWKHIK